MTVVTSQVGGEDNSSVVSKLLATAARFGLPYDEETTIIPIAAVAAEGQCYLVHVTHFPERLSDSAYNAGTQLAQTR